MDAIETLKFQRRGRLAKVRPVGSRIPSVRAKVETHSSFDWEQGYHTEFCASGTAALAMAVAVAIGERQFVSGPEVILPAYGCPDLVAAVLAQKAKPVLVDLAPDSPHMDLEQVKEAISPATAAVVGVGFLGIPERLEQLCLLCHDSGVTLIEDSAQCFPPASSSQHWADLIVLSFGRGKPVNLMGGGALLVRRNILTRAKPVVDQFPLLKMELGLKWKIKRLVFNFILRRFPYSILEKLPGLNIGETKFKALEVVQRLALPEQLVLSGLHHFRQRLPIHLEYKAKLQALNEAGWMFLDEMTLSNHVQCRPRNRFGILAPSTQIRDRAERELNRAGIGASGFYRWILPAIEGVPGFRGIFDYPNARNFADRMLTLPCHEDVTEADIALAAKALNRLI